MQTTLAWWNDGDWNTSLVYLYQMFTKQVNQEGKNTHQKSKKTHKKFLTPPHPPKKKQNTKAWGEALVLAQINAAKASFLNYWLAQACQVSLTAREGKEQKTSPWMHKNHNSISIVIDFTPLPDCRLNIFYKLDDTVCLWEKKENIQSNESIPPTSNNFWYLPNYSRLGEESF